MRALPQGKFDVQVMNPGMIAHEEQIKRLRRCARQRRERARRACIEDANNKARLYHTLSLDTKDMTGLDRFQALQPGKEAVVVRFEDRSEKVIFVDRDFIANHQADFIESLPDKVQVANPDAVISTDDRQKRVAQCGRSRRIQEDHRDCVNKAWAQSRHYNPVDVDKSKISSWKRLPRGQTPMVATFRDGSSRLIFMEPARLNPADQ